MSTRETLRSYESVDQYIKALGDRNRAWGDAHADVFDTLCGARVLAEHFEAEPSVQTILAIACMIVESRTK